MGLLYSFSGDMDGGNPWAPPIQGADGSLYGTRTYGPDPNDLAPGCRPESRLTGSSRRYTNSPTMPTAATP